MKKYNTIADLGPGGHGWIITKDFVGPYYIAEITIEDEVNQFRGPDTSGTSRVDTSCNVLVTLMPRWLVSIHMESDGVRTTRCKEVFADTIVYPTRAEAEKNWLESNKILDSAKEKLIQGIKEKQSDINWRQVRVDASISILNSLLETTQHSVAEEIAINDIYAKTAIAYADTLIKELKKSEDEFEKLLEL